MRVAMLLHKSVEFDSRVRREASSLAAAGHEVIVLELAYVPGGRATLEGFARRSCLGPRRLRGVLPRWSRRPLMLVSFVREIVRARPDIVHAHDAAMLLPGAIGARLTGARLVYDSHELATGVAYHGRAWGWFVSATESAIVPRCAAVMTVSDGIAARLRDRYELATTPTVVRNVSALQVKGNGGLRTKLGLGPEVPLILHQGAPAPDRGCEVLISAAASLDDVHVVFLGAPEPGYQELLADIVSDKGVSDRVTLLPSVALEELLAYTAEADVGVTLLQDTCENHRLALPNKLFEYIAAGLPVVASDLPEMRQLIESYGIGWCVEPDKPQVLAVTLAHAIAHRTDPDLRRNLARAATELTWTREQVRLTDLYARLDSLPSAVRLRPPAKRFPRRRRRAVSTTLPPR